MTLSQTVRQLGFGKKVPSFCGDRFTPGLLQQFNRRKRSVGRNWHMDQAYIKVHGQWMYLHRAVDSAGDAVEFWFSEHLDLLAAEHFLRKALHHHGRPD